jgi:hypothetical protein
MVVIYHRNTPLPKVQRGLDGYRTSEFENCNDVVQHEWERN